MIWRELPNCKQNIFLTFDDGPNPLSTPAVLATLRALRVPATFFVIGEKQRRHPELMRQILLDGHAVGSHSTDHRYHHLFRGRVHLQRWLEASRDELERVAPSIGFRPPAGVITPPLHRAARALKVPLILWNERFYDAVFPWSESRAARSAARLTGGSIVLLHDSQRAERVPGFCLVLERYIEMIRARGFALAALARPELSR